MSRRLGKHGLPRRRLFTVREVDATRGCALLDNTEHPRLNPWQSLRKISKAPQWMTILERQLLPPLQFAQQLAVDRNDSKDHPGFTGTIPGVSAQRLQSTKPSNTVKGESKTLPIAESPKARDDRVGAREKQRAIIKQQQEAAQQLARDRRAESARRKMIDEEHQAEKAAYDDITADYHAAALYDEDAAFWMENMDVLQKGHAWMLNKLIARSQDDVPSREHYESMRAIFGCDDIHGVDKGAPGLTVLEIMQL